jgi:outer membrane receptor protein involved in Fe transport
LKRNLKVYYAVTAILTGSSVGWSAKAEQAAAATDGNDSGQLQAITVTAQRRTENIQDVPITVQALSADALKQQSISTFDDVVRFLPNVAFATNGPGQGNIYMRGLSIGMLGSQGEASIESFPNVAVYLDDQSVQFPARNLDIYAVDMSRIEVLEGPQGTLFGGGAEAGAVRYITNKPKLNVTEGSAEASYSTTAGGDPNSSANLVLNLPLIEDHLAVRGVLYSERRGGYIDNVPTTFSRQNTDDGTYRLGVPASSAGTCPNGLPPGPKAGGAPYGVCVPLGLPVVNNNNVVQNAQNPVTYSGVRGSALYQIDDDWNVLISQAYQDMQADGYSAQYPVSFGGQQLQPLQMTAFGPAYEHDWFENTALTIHGKLGVLTAIYTGAYLVRKTQQESDYTGYARAQYGDYYQCTGGAATVATANGAGTAQPPRCYSPVSNWYEWMKNSHLSQEMRLSTPDDWRVRGVVGAYYEDFKILDATNFNYKSDPSCYSNPALLAASNAGGAPCVGNSETIPGTTASFPGVRGDTTSFFEDIQRGYKQTAIYTSVDYDLIPKVLTVTGGTRWYHYSEFETGSKVYTSTSCANVPVCSPGVNLDAANLTKTYNGFTSRGNVTWHVTDGVMVYATYSQGYRPGGFNRANGMNGVGPAANGVDQYFEPKSYAPDTLTNYETGMKSEFLDHRLVVNLSGYHMKWSNVQTVVFNPQAFGTVVWENNGPDYRINGAELQLVGLVTQGLTLQGSASYNDAKQTNNPCMVSNNPASPTYGSCITETLSAGIMTPLLSVYGPQGGTPAFSPKLKFNVQARYDWSFYDYTGFATAVANYVDKMYNQVDNGTTNYVGPAFTELLRYEQPAYSTFDASIGIAKDKWTAQLFGTNLGNSNASVYTNSAQYIKAEVPLRPRVLGLKFGYRF